MKHRKFRKTGSPEKPTYKSKPVFELHHGVQSWKIYANGYVEGFPEGTLVVNRMLPLIHFTQRLMQK